MLPRSLVRLKALVLVVVLLDGGGGLPLLDLALYHRHASQAARGSITSAYIGDAAAQSGHGQICRLGCTLADSTGTPAVDPGLSRLAPPHRLPALAALALRSRAPSHTAERPRAPPTVLA